MHKYGHITQRQQAEYVRGSLVVIGAYLIYKFAERLELRLFRERYNVANDRRNLDMAAYGERSYNGRVYGSDDRKRLTIAL